MKLDSRFRTGDFATGLNNEITVTVRVLGPSWAKADRLDLYANGQLIHTRPIKPGSDIEKANLKLTLPRPKHDAHLIAIATGPGITEPFWESPRPYVPTSPKHEPRLQGATNPIFIDGDGDGKYTAPRQQAEQLLVKHPKNLDALFGALAGFDAAVAAQLAALLHQAGHDLQSPKLKAKWSKIRTIAVGFEAFIATQED